LTIILNFGLLLATMNYQYLNPSKILDHLHHSLSGLRSARANASVLDSIMVEMYGSKLSVKEVASISQPEPTQLMISPFDKSAIKAIVKAITESNLGINPVDDGMGVRLNFPPLTEETRKKLAKSVNVLAEEAKVSVRNNRQDVLKGWKKEKEESLLSEDELKRLEGELQKEVDSLNKEVEAVAKKKEEDILKV
jgi:ribosome recycling factor